MNNVLLLFISFFFVLIIMIFIINKKQTKISILNEKLIKLDKYVCEINNKIIRVNSVVKLNYVEIKEKKIIKISSIQIKNDPTNIYYNDELGKLLIGRTIGDKVILNLNGDKSFNIEILSVINSDIFE